MRETRCPACQTTPLAPTVVEPGLLGLGCGRCHGQWLSAENYWRWAEHPSPPSDDAGSDAPVIDTGPAKRCPDCGHFLAHRPVGHGVGFHVDGCGTCGGVWLDAGEWADLRRRGLHDRVHHVFSPAWQAAVARDERTAARERAVRAKLGDADYAEAGRVRAWVAAHPHRAELIAYLTPDEGLPGKRAGA